MKSTLVGNLSVQNRSRWSRLVVASCAMALMLCSASAQLATATIGGNAAAPAGSSNSGSGTFNAPSNVVVDANGNVYIADTFNHAVRKITSAGVVTTLAGTGTAGTTSDATAGAPAAQFNAPRGIAMNSAGTTLYISDTGGNSIRMVTLTAIGGTVAGVSTLVPAGTFSSPVGIAADGSGNLYVADSGNNVIRKVVIAGPTVTRLAGSATGVSGLVNGDADTSRFSTPFGVALNAAGDTLYVADYNNHAIRRIAGLAGTVAVTTYAGTGTASFADNTTGTSAAFRNPSGVSVDASGNVYVADFGNNSIRLVAIAAGNAVTTPVGPAATGSVAGATGSTDGTGTTAQFKQPFGATAITLSSTAFVYIADQGNNTIRRASAQAAPTVGSPTPASQAANVGANNVQFTATSTGFPAPTLQWERNPGGNTSFSAIVASANYSGVNTNTLVINGVTLAMNSDTFRLSATNTVSGPVVSALPAQLTVNQTPTFATASITFNATVGQPFSQSVVATGSGTITYSPASLGFGWSLAPNGTITGNPTSINDSISNVTVTATNSVGMGTQLVSIVVAPASSNPIISAHPVNYTVPVGQTSVNGAFAVNASTSNPAVSSYQWQIRQADLTTFVNLANDGVYSGVTTASLNINAISPALNGAVYRVVVTNSAGFTNSNSATLIVSSSPAFTNATATTFIIGQANTFTFTATGVPAPTFSTASTLPGGVSLSTSGVLSGNPSDATGSPFNLVVTAVSSAGSISQNPFVLAVSTAAAAAAIATQPVPAIVQLGANATFTASATGSPTPTLRWQRQPSGTNGLVDLVDDAVYTGTTTGTLTVTNVAAGMSGDQFKLVATNTVNGVPGSASSNLVALTVNIGTTISTFVGEAGLSGSTDATGAAARFNTPAGITVDSSGNFYVADAANHVIRKITAAGVVSTLAGQPGASGNTDGVGSAARFSAPAAVAVDSVGTVFVADTYNHTIRAVAPNGTVTTLAGLANNGGSADGTGSAARFSFPGGIASDGSANIYVADSSNHTIRRITTGGVVTTFAGTAGSAGAANGNGAAARFSFPNGLAIGQLGVLYVADSFNHLIRRISPSGDVTALAGGAGVAGSVDGNGIAARFNQPTGVAADSAGNVYVADTFSHTIRRIATNGDVTTLAGAVGVAGSTDGVGLSARFNQPFGLTVDANGNVYIADTRNNTIRRSGTTSAPGISTQPQNRVVVVGTNATFTVVATGTPAPSYQWQRQPAGTSGFNNLTNDSVHSGVATATLTIANVTTGNSGDQYRVILTNGINPFATSDAATLTVGAAPVFTSGTTATFKATEAGTFTIAASGLPASTFSVTGNPSWLTLNTTTGVVSGTPPLGSEGQYTLTFTANNGVAVPQTFTLTVLPGVVAPTITTQPVSLALNQGQTATFTVVAAGTAPLTYQWRRNSVAIPGATGSSLTIANVQPVNAGAYGVSVTNAANAVVSNIATLAVNTPPAFASQPQAQLALAGSSVTFEAATTGSASSSQWRKNGVAIAGATNASFTLFGVSTADVASYDVIVTNSLGTITSSPAQLTLATAATAPLITSRPASRTVLAGESTILRVGATGIPAPTYQWRKDGALITGATSATLTLTNVQADAAAGYDVAITNGSGGVTTSPAAFVRVIARSYAGVYFGSFSSGAGTFALMVREDNTGVFLGFLTGSNSPVLSQNVIINDNGTFSFSQGAIAALASVSPNDNEPARAAALGSVSVSGAIGTDGALSGSIGGGANASLSGNKTADTGATQSLAGFYQAGSSSNSAVAYTIAAANGQALVVAQNGNSYDGGMGTVGSSGAVTVVTARSTTIAQTISSSGTVTGTSSGVVNATLSGGNEAALARQRLVNISSRARVGTGDAVAIAGFVISGEESKLVLIRAVGPTLGAVPFNLGGALASPRLELFRGSTSLAVNAGIGATRAAIDAASAQAGAFPLGASGSDAAMLITLAPGNYTAIVSSTTNAAGVALVEVYDLSAAAPGQKLLNIATRAAAGAGDNLLIAGFVVPPGTSKRVLVRAVGPGLTPFGITGVLAQPTLLLFSGSTTIAQNANWRTSADADVITASSASVGAFGLATNDSAMVVTLAPGNYTAQVLGSGTSTGIALIEVYELP